MSLGWLGLVFALAGSFLPTRSPAEENRSLSLSLSSTTLQAGQNNYQTVAVNSLEGISSLVVSVYYDAEAFQITSYSNRTTASLVDPYMGEGFLRYSYIFGSTQGISSNLFRYYVTANEGTAPGDYRFDVFVEEAYDDNLEPVTIDPCSRIVTVAQKSSQQSRRFYATPSASSVNKGEELNVYYSLNNADIASGQLEWTYDEELFDCLGFSEGLFFKGKICDLNMIPGKTIMSFASNAYGSSVDVGTLRLKAKKNVDAQTTIKLTVKELFDLDLNSMRGVGTTTNILIQYDPTLESAGARMAVSSSEYPYRASSVTASISLSANSLLGAGDFTLLFDPQYLQYVSATKGFAPDFFTINKQAVTEGTLKFSIISMTDLVDAVDVLEVTFNVIGVPSSREVPLTLTGKGTSDSLTNPIVLDYVSSAVRFLPYSTEEFAQDLLDATDSICASTGDHNVALAQVWTTLSGYWELLGASNQQAFIEAIPDYEGVSEDAIERASGRYHYVVGKYNLNNFVGLNVSLFGAGSTANLLGLRGDSASLAFLLILTLCSAVSGPLLLFAKHRREETSDHK